MPATDHPFRHRYLRKVWAILVAFLATCLLAGALLAPSTGRGVARSDSFQATNTDYPGPNNQTPAPTVILPTSTPYPDLQNPTAAPTLAVTTSSPSPQASPTLPLRPGASPSPSPSATLTLPAIPGTQAPAPTLGPSPTLKPFPTITLVFPTPATPAALLAHRYDPAQPPAPKPQAGPGLAWLTRLWPFALLILIWLALVVWFVIAQRPWE